MERTDRGARILVLLGELRDEALAATEDELEELSDEIIDAIMARLPLPGWVPFLRGWLRGKLDELLPYRLFDAMAQAVVKIRQRRAAEGKLLL